MLKYVKAFILTLLIPGICYAASYRSPISVKIELKKTAFELYEPIEGDVILNSYTPGSLPAVFEVKLYKQGLLKYQGLANIPTVFAGTTRLPLKNVGIPNINDSPAAVGEWHLAILQQNVDPSKTARVTFEIVEPKENK